MGGEKASELLDRLIADLNDWRGALLAFAGINEAAVVAALPEEK